jgi:hypothetical protein
MGLTSNKDGPHGPGGTFTLSWIIPARELRAPSRILMVIDDIRTLLTAPSPAAAKPFLERVDVTLTDGYAHALQLEAERWRIERRIAEVVAGLPAGTDTEHEPELVALAERLTTANESIVALRALLTSLRERRSELANAA